MKSRLIFVVFTAFLLTQLFACGTLSIRDIDVNDAAARRYAENGDLPREVESLARPLVEHGETPGIVVGVLSSDGSTQFFGYGFANDLDRRAPDADTLFPVGSLSKGFLGALVNMLVDENVLSWDESLETALPPNIPLSADARKITVRQLAMHTSGLPRQPMKPRMLAYVAEYLFTGKNFYRHIDRDYTLKFLAEFKAPKNQEKRYSNIGYALLGYIVERRTGVSLDTLLEQRIVRPLGLHATGYVGEILPGFASRALGHAGDQPKFIPRGAQVPDWPFNDFLKGSAAVYSTPRDLLKFAQAQFPDHNPGHQTVSQLTSSSFLPTRESPPIGWHVDVIDGHRITYQVGVVAGYTSYIGMDIENRTAVVVLQNSFNWTDHVGHKLLMRMAVASDRHRQMVSLSP